MELSGIIKKIGETQTFASGFQKTEVVLLTEEQYPQPINIEFLQDKSDLPAFHKERARVKIGINIRGREWTSPQGEVKYFNSIVGWKIEKLEDAKTPAAERETPEAWKRPETAAPQAAGNIFEEEDDDLPF